MDLNGDGNVDILSGSYSRMERDMAGLFFVLWGNDDGSFSEAETLTGSDGEPLLIPGSREENLTDRICTRPTAADINGDGYLDIVSGNFTGTFFVFEGQGQGKFAPGSKQIMAGDSPLKVQAHSDPFLIDWDGDGDLDIVSGSGAGGVFLSTNVGSKTEAKFSEAVALVPAAGHSSMQVQLGDDHLSGPQSATRVWVDDINEDGKLDLLVGDSLQLTLAAEGVDAETALDHLKQWNEKQHELASWWQQASKEFDMEAISKLQIKKMNQGKEASEGEEADDALSEEELATLEAYQKVMADYNERYSKSYESRNEFVRQEMTGSVWVFYQK